MTTSLAEQLQRLVVPQTEILKRDKKRPSILFDPKKSAEFSREIFYQIGIEGLEELINKNESFAEFRETLFNVTSKQFERSVQNNDANEKLNKNLRKFFLLLSPYVLLNCSHKALEWLIHRFYINEYNRNDLLMLCLPYHESNIFIKVLHIVKFRDKGDHFYFLKKVQETGCHLPKQSLLNHAASSIEFIKYTSKYIKDLLKVHSKYFLLSTAFNFYCTVFSGALEYCKEVTEDQISQMLPLILNGLNSAVSDYCAASYVITAKLVSKKSLSDKLLNKFVEKISELKTDLKTEACLLLVIIYESQEQYKTVPSIAVANLVEKEWLPLVLRNLEKSGNNIYPFLERLLNAFIVEGVKNDLKLARDMMKICLDQLKIRDELVSTILNIILDSFSSQKKVSEEIQNWLKEIIQKLENQYPSLFDTSIYIILSTTLDEKSIKYRRCLNKLLNNAAYFKDKLEISDKLNHSDASVRSKALKILSDNYENFKDIEKQMINNYFIDKLRSNDVNVVKDAIKIIKKTCIIEKDLLKQVLMCLAAKYQEDKVTWEIIYKDLTYLLLTLYPPNDWEVFMTILPFLIPSETNELPKAIELLDTPYILNHDILKHNIDRLKRAEDEESFVKILFEILTNNTNVQYLTFFIEVLKNSPIDNWNSYQKYVSFLILCTIIPKNSSLEVAYEVLDFLLLFFKGTHKKFVKKSSVTNYIKEAVKGKFPTQGFLHALVQLTNKIKKPEVNLKLRDFSIDTLENKFFITITKILIENIDLFKKFLNQFFDNIEEESEFLLNLLLCGSNILDENFKLQALMYVKTLINENKTDAASMIHLEKFVPLFLLSLLSDKEEKIRQMIIDIFVDLVGLASRKTNSFYCLLNSIIKTKEEVILDHEQIPEIVFQALDTTKSKNKKDIRDISILKKHLFKICVENDCPVYLKSGILYALSMLNSFDILESLSNLALDLLKQNPEEISSFNAKIIFSIVAKINSTVINKLNVTSKTWQLIETFINKDKTVIYTDVENKYSLTLLVLKQLDKELFNAIQDTDVTKKLLDIVVEKSVSVQNPEVLSVSVKIFKHVDLDANWIMDTLVIMKDIISPKIDPNKKRRVGVIPNIDVLDTLEWKKGVTVLEFIQNKKKIRNRDILLPIFFDILKRCSDFDEQSAIIEYSKQLLLSLILDCCNKIEGKIPENKINIELIVQCIRSSQNPQTHHHALLVLTHLAQIVPIQVLHHMMPIFTFMGSSILRQDDAYSFQIIFKIIDTIIPIIVNEENNETCNVSQVLRVFVDALLDVPDHRRTALFKKLLERISVKENLYLFLLHIFESQVTITLTNKEQKEAVKKKLDVALDLCIEFPPEVVINNCIKLMNYLQKLPDEKEENMQIGDAATLDISMHTPKEFRHYKYIMVKFMANLLSSQQFVNLVAALNSEEELNLETPFKDLIVIILQYIQRISVVAEKNVNTPQAQYWKVMLHLSYDILDSVNALITAPMFLLVTKGLMVHKLGTVRRRILELLNNTLQHNYSFFEECDKAEIYSLIPSIITIIESVVEDIDYEQETIVQIALLSLKLLIKYLAAKDPEKFINILEFITGILKSGKAQNNILASVVLCLAELCVTLRSYAISSLPDYMPVLIQILKKEKNADTSSVLLKSLVTAIEKIFDSMPLFLSPYLEKLLIEITKLVSRWADMDEKEMQQIFTTKLNSLTVKIGSTVPLRVLLPSIESCFNSLLHRKQFSACCSLMDILRKSISNASVPDVNSNITELTNLFLEFLKFRTDTESTLEDANKVESHIVSAFTVLTLKLSENTFRPLYYKFYNWAIRSEVKNDRLITFYTLSSKISQSLKGLFVLFAGHFINNAAQILDSCNKIKNEELCFKDDSKNILLLENVLTTLNSVFLYDSKNFINRERFNILMQPLVDQFENTLGGFEELKKRNVDLVTPCLVNFSVATADDALWKQMNYQVLLKMRHNEPTIRLTALHYLIEFVRKLGEDFLPLLPETIPFLAELLEDEDESVEKAVQKAIQEMEKILGEPLQKYF